MGRWYTGILFYGGRFARMPGEIGLWLPSLAEAALGTLKAVPSRLQTAVQIR